MSSSPNQSFKESDETKPLKLGPFGSENGGESFDDGVHSTVRQLVISTNDQASRIVSIQIEYDDNGSSFLSDKHGKEDDYYTDTIRLDYPYEFLTSVHGKYVKLWRLPTYIYSLTFRSNRKTYGPYGDEGSLGKYFSIQAPGKMIVGFHGRTSMFMNLRALGAYLKPVDHNLNEKYNPSKHLADKGSSMVPASLDPANPLLPATYPFQTKLIKKHEDEGDKQISCIISGNEVSGNEGNRSGGFAVGNKYINTYYYYSEKFMAMYN
ncbi:jacalin-related lectin 3-like [Rosa sericea]